MWRVVGGGRLRQAGGAAAREYAPPLEWCRPKNTHAPDCHPSLPLHPTHTQLLGSLLDECLRIEVGEDLFAKVRVW